MTKSGKKRERVREKERLGQKHIDIQPNRYKEKRQIERQR